RRISKRSLLNTAFIGLDLIPYCFKFYIFSVGVCESTLLRPRLGRSVIYTVIARTGNTRHTIRAGRTNSYTKANGAIYYLGFYRLIVFQFWHGPQVAPRFMTPVD